METNNLANLDFLAAGGIHVSQTQVYTTVFWVFFQKKKSSCEGLCSKVKQHPGGATIVTAVLARQYARALRHQWNGSKAWRKHFLLEVAKIIRREASNLLKGNTSLSLCQDITLSNIQAFSWDTTLAAIEKAAPLLFYAVRAIVTSKKTEESLVTDSGRNLKPIIGNALSCLLRGRRLRKVKFIPALNSMQLRKNGLKSVGLNILSKTGACMSHNSTMKVIGKLSSGIDDAVQAYIGTSSVQSDSVEIHSDSPNSLEQADKTNKNAEDMDSDDDQVSEDDLEDQVSEDDLEDQISEDDLEDQVSENEIEDHVDEDDLEGQVNEDDLGDHVGEDDLEDQVSEDDLKNRISEDDLDNHVIECDLENHISEDDLENYVIECDLENHLENHIGEDDLENHVSEYDLENHVGEDVLEDWVSKDELGDQSENEGHKKFLEDRVIRNYQAPIGKVNVWNTEVEDLLMTCENAGNNGPMTQNKVRSRNRKLKGSNDQNHKDNG